MFIASNASIAAVATLAFMGDPSGLRM